MIDNSKKESSSGSSKTRPLVEWAEGLLWLIALFWVLAILAYFIKPWFPGWTWALACWATIFTIFSWPFGLCLLVIEVARMPNQGVAWRLFMIYLVVAALLIFPIGCTLAPLQSGVA